MTIRGQFYSTIYISLSLKDKGAIFMRHEPSRWMMSQ